MPRLTKKEIERLRNLSDAKDLLYRALDEIEALQEENKKLQFKYDTVRKMADERVQNREERLAAAVEVIRWYAKKDHYLDMPQDQRFQFNATIDRDMGDKARQFLNEGTKKGEK